MSAAEQREPTGQVGAPVWVLLVGIGAAAFTISFAALADLAYLAGIRGSTDVFRFEFRLAYLFPLSIDAFAIAATIVWLRRRVAPDAIRVACWSAWSAIGATVVGNAYHAYAVADHDGPIPWPVAVAISAVPPVALGAVVHLAVLVGRVGPDPTPVGDPTEPEWRTAYRLGLDDALAVEWHLALAGWSASPTEGSDDGEDDAEPGSWAPPARGESDDVFAADLRSVNLDRGSADLDPLPRDAVIARYGVGARRARRLRELAEQPAPVKVGRDTADPGRVPIGRGAGEQLAPDPIARATRSERDVDAEPVGAGSGPGRPGSGVVGRAEV